MSLPPPGSSLAALFDAPMAPGRLLWIGLRPSRREAMHTVPHATLEPGRGLTGDRYRNKDGARQVTIVAAEHLAAIGAYLGRDPIPPEILRRNLVVSGINLAALKSRRFRIGAALLEHSGACHPCSRMEEALGPGGYNAVRDHGGITARVIEGGAIALGDALIREA
jgi:MOSC domain-containing protein YiiM